MIRFAKIAVIGAGSVGVTVGGLLALAGADITFIARGATLAALKTGGATLIDPAGRRCPVPAKAAAIEDAGPFDLVILALKAQHLGHIAASLAPLFGPGTPVVAIQNGLPWWYFTKSGGPFEGRRIAAVDPEGRIGAAIDGARVVGGVIYVAAHIRAPAVVHATEINRMILGEPDGALSPRLTALAEMFSAAGLKTAASADIRSALWTKLWGNSTFNPISALTGAGLSDICNDPGTRALAAAAMAEVERVAGRLGVRMAMSIEDRIAVTAKLGNHKTSMLQDIEAGRAPELDANVGAVVELARLLGEPTPLLDMLHTGTRLLTRAAAGAS